MKKIALSLACIFSLNITAADALEINEQQETANIEVRIADFQSQAPVLAGYFIESLGKGLVAGTTVNLLASPFNTPDYVAIGAYTGVLSNALLNNCDKEQEAARCVDLADRCNARILDQYRAHIEATLALNPEFHILPKEAQEFVMEGIMLKVQEEVAQFKPEQFEVKNRAYSAAATILGFAAGAYVGSKLGTGMYNGCAWLFNWYNQKAPAINDNYIDLGHTQPKE